MVYDLAFFYTALAVGILTLYSILKRANGWYYTIKFSSKKYHIPPGDMGWPYVGNTLFYFTSFISDYPDSFLSYFLTRFGPGGMYKGYIFGKPSIIVTKPEITRKILMDEENLDRGMPNYMKRLVGLTTSIEEDKCIRRLTAPIKSHGFLSDAYFDHMNEVMKTSFEKWAAMEEPIKFLSEMKKPTFEVFMRILVGGEVDQELFDAVFKENNCIISGVCSLPINIPGFAYNKAIKARRALAKILQQILVERRKAMIAKDYKAMPKSNIIDMLLDDDDDEGKGLNDEKIIRMLILFSFAGYEPVALMATKAIMFLEKHPEFLQKAKEEQEDIVKRRSSSNVGLSFGEIRQMKYLSKVINETLRIASNQTVFLKDTNTPYNINGYTIPRGWKFFALAWNIHMDPDIYVKPEEFNPSRWDDLETKPGSLLPFSMGPRACPGSNLAKLEISVILHYFLLYYRLEQVNPEIKTYPTENCLVRFKKLSV
ncbi:beta-amyrin 11-oxidase-like isoform X1 [Lycium barbarum]|uniref:beta-amyrin 11-oxidase-like isoform X1 n=1 Tax=Lycium barbarum TaxID=112863 RepID=UPI00293F0A76|nr:beta-amyrin 11-oxidase-like isoform X1 [Lycium barbarum]